MYAKITQPSAQIFSSDPLEQVYAKSALDPVMGGLAGMFAQISANRRRQGQNEYMQGVSESNQIAGRVAQQEAQQKHEQELIKGALKLLELGQSGMSMPILSKIIQGGSMNEGSDLTRSLINSNIVKNMRDPNGSSGGVKVKGTAAPGGTGGMEFTGTGPNARQQVEEQLIAAQKFYEKNGMKFSPDAARSLLSNYGQK